MEYTTYLELAVVRYYNSLVQHYMNNVPRSKKRFHHLNTQTTSNRRRTYLIKYLSLDMVNIRVLNVMLILTTISISSAIIAWSAWWLNSLDYIKAIQISVLSLMLLLMSPALAPAFYQEIPDVPKPVPVLKISKKEAPSTEASPNSRITILDPETETEFQVQTVLSATTSVIPIGVMDPLKYGRNSSNRVSPKTLAESIPATEQQ